MTHEEFPNEAAAGVFDGQQDRALVDAHVVVTDVVLVQIEGVGEAVATGTRITPNKRPAGGIGEPE